MNVELFMSHGPSQSKKGHIFNTWFLSSNCFAYSKRWETETLRVEAKGRNLRILMLAHVSATTAHLFPLALQIYTAGEQLL